jgi:hypothetical protein
VEAAVRVIQRGHNSAGIFLLLLAAAGCRSAAVVEEVQVVTDQIPLDRMTATQRYYGLAGGLADNGQPSVTPVNGRIVIAAISMSNGNLEYSRFIQLYANHQDVEPQIGLVNCAQGGNALERWLSDPSLWSDCRQRIQAAGFSPEQVRVIWAKDANQFTDHGRTLPDPAADYYDLVKNIAALSQRIGTEFPSVQAIFHSSRIYGGYTSPDRQPARGEPISYEGGLAINAVIERYRRGELPGSPWIGWGPYLWSKGAEPNAAGIFWLPGDYNSDRIHPGQSGQTKVADALHRHFLQFDWYRR